MKDSPFNAKTFPIYLGYAGMFFAGLKIALPDPKPIEVDPAYLDFKKTILLVITMIFYGATILKVGFFLSTSLFLVASYYFLGERRWKYILIFSFPFVAIFMYLLHGLLAVYLRDPLIKIYRNNGMIEGILIGLKTALSFQNLMMVMIGCFAGTIIGMLPGLGPMTAIALMIPITYGFDPATGLILMAGVYYGAVFGGSTSSILINAPGVPGTVATSFDGYPMAQQGKAGKALAIAAYSSFAGGTIAAIFLLFAAPSLSKVSLSFRSPDYFGLMILGLTAVAAFSSKGQFFKSNDDVCIRFNVSISRSR